MNTSHFRKLFFLALTAGFGLFVLQVYWMQNEWKNSTSLLQRQIDHAFRSAVDSEQSLRKNKLNTYLESILNDSNYIGIKPRYNEKEKKWMVMMFDTRNKKDYSSWTDTLIATGPIFSPNQKKQFIHQYIMNNVSRNIEEDVIFFYTQRFGELWTTKYHGLYLDTGYLKNRFSQELTEQNIHSNFRIIYTDTSTQTNILQKDDWSFTTKPNYVNFNSINDSRKKYQAVAYVYHPLTLLIRRLWLALLATFLMLSLCFYCLYKMYEALLKQKELHELKNDFISNMTHELKTPIATVRAAIDGLQFFDALQDQEKSLRYLNTSRTELQRLDELVTKVLEISVYERHLLELNKEKIDLEQMLEIVVQTFEVKGNTFTYHINPYNIKTTVNADRTHIKNVLYNLVDNAIKYVPDNLHLEFSLTTDENYIMLAVADNGAGIEERHLPRIFEKFYRITTSNLPSVKGFGLGLFYVKKIIEQHGGTIKVESEINKGTAFMIQLPIK